MAYLAGNENRKGRQKELQNTPTQLEREHPAIETSQNRRVAPSFLEDVPANIRTRGVTSPCDK